MLRTSAFKNTELSPSRRRLADLMKREESRMSLAEATLLIAAEEYPGLDRGRYLTRFEQMAVRLQPRANPRKSPASNIQALNAELFGHQAFRGNTEDYYDPRNSFLNEVLDRRLGIPITLSAVYLEVAERLSLPVVGVGLPGHFIVKYLTPTEEIYIDPFHQGAPLQPQDCQERLRTVYGEEAELKPHHLLAAGKKEILARMLRNLKGIYTRNRFYEKTLQMIGLALIVNPNSAVEIRDRGLVHFEMKRYAESRADFQAYLATAPPGDPHRREVARALHHIRALMN